MITYQLEKWAPFSKDAKPLFKKHWEEIAIDRDKIHLSLDYDKYQGMDDSGILHVLTMRNGKRLVGYYIAFILPHTHYSQAGIMAFTDIYFVSPEQRTGINGIQLFVEAEKSLRERGVTKAYLSTKVHKDNGPIFERLGWKLSDKSYTKLLI